MTRRASLRSHFLGMFASGALLTFAFQPTQVGSVAAVAAAAEPVTVKGAGSQAVAPEMTPWGDTMAAADRPTNIQYVGSGSGDGLTLFKLQQLDYVISGVPYTDAELAGLDLIRAPITVTAGVPLVTVPRTVGAGIGWQTTTTVYHLGTEGGQWTNCLNDPNDPDYDPSCIEVQIVPFTAPVRIPPQNFLAMFLDYPYNPGSDPLALYREWGQPDVKAALGGTLPDAWVGQRVPQVVNRTERSATNLYLQEYAKQMAPTMWSSLKAATPGVLWDPPREQLPVGITRYGLETAIGLAAIGGVEGTSLAYSASNLVFVPAAWADKTIADYPNAQFRKVQVTNGAGEYVVASPESINAAVAAGGQEPLYAAENNVPGAYPITWINYIYVPAVGLSIDKANALAATIRFVATSGQNDAAAFGDGRLTSVMAQEALAAADAVVTSNCSGADRTVVDAPVGGWEPDLAELDAIGTVKRCEAVVAPPPTTTTTTSSTTTTTTTTVAETTTSTTEPAPVAPATTSSPPTTRPTSSVLTSTTAAFVPPTTGVIESPPATVPTPPPETTTTRAPPARLPLPAPSDGRGGFKSLATFVMGSGLFLVGRKLLAAIVATL